MFFEDKAQTCSNTFTTCSGTNRGGYIKRSDNLDLSANTSTSIGNHLYNAEIENLSSMVNYLKLLIFHVVDSNLIHYLMVRYSQEIRLSLSSLSIQADLFVIILLKEMLGKQLINLLRLSLSIIMSQ